jgi:hypothetical protein
MSLQIHHVMVIHEFQDRAGDMEAGVSTLATALDRSRVRILVNLGRDPMGGSQPGPWP